MMPDPTSSVPGLTDRRALERNRARALRLGPVDFLHRIVADEIEDRLAEVNRRFSAVAVVTGQPQFWRDAMPSAAIVADTPVLALEPGAHDLVIHALALHWAEDPVGQIAQAARALRPDGLFIAACPGGRSLHELRDALTRAEAEVTGGLSPRVLPMGEIRDLGGLLPRAGLALPVADQITQIASYRSLFHLARDLRAMGEGNALAQRLRRPTRRDVLLRAAALYAENHPDPQDETRIRATFDLVFLTGWAPDASQQKPLRPGSARMPLAEALASTRKPE
ncbi:methyltransferase domain-containing protein [Paracoccus sp. P2]|uniref:Methyltransferase domain-containing protein n=1 Tax=Paracoccus pantotrophus TaxID=82367 RepID=A0A454NN93_PARPN|nr:methyltransferase domain-containing protein [Paracoccus pantotrophus]QFG36776.1 methyltransferase domain-containing protein [Paracoccus pantotrophus]QLH14340.1 methyltransferase domain-containing protein [Paracoccus pantotrophus]RDD98051.1 methyltransferase domain-containing protein [Paracoccus pantotrophus]RKS52820.1 methyltransferase family protein [Paracoccus pantotrophus]RNI18552.1 methyltransferase domain-containing protein [Paracoccus pantotrophus]